MMLRDGIISYAQELNKKQPFFLPANNIIILRNKEYTKTSKTSKGGEAKTAAKKSGNVG